MNLKDFIANVDAADEKTLNRMVDAVLAVVRVVITDELMVAGGLFGVAISRLAEFRTRTQIHEAVDYWFENNREVLAIVRRQGMRLVPAPCDGDEPLRCCMNMAEICSDCDGRPARLCDGIRESWGPGPSSDRQSSNPPKDPPMGSAEQRGCIFLDGPEACRSCGDCGYFEGSDKL